ncbi:hypothetical protein E8E14_014709 [Neopestalotiopsis sp. 37M]|nr:hypothetical protein E8E14_014709 [Neopestalotiopsis sp. 37M]
MPGRKRADGTGPIRRRARTGCKSCRERKVKCDETKPVCRNCSSRGLPCHSGLQLKWHEEFASRGVAFGRQGVWTKDPKARGSPPSPSQAVSNETHWLSVPEIGSHHFVHADFTDFEPEPSEPRSPDMLAEPDECTTTSSALSSCIVVPPVFRDNLIPHYWDNMTNKRQVDSWMGCSPELAGILCDITELGRAKTAGTMHAIELFERSDAMEARIHSLQSVTQVPNDDELIWSAELKRLSALIYLHCVLYDATPSTPIVSQLVRQILEQVLRMLRTGRARALAFPVFVTAVELDPTDDIVIRDEASDEAIHGRRLILETLEAMSTDSLSNVTRIRAVVKKVWKLRDMNVGENMGLTKPNPGQSNDWATFVGPNSLYISLA